MVCLGVLYRTHKWQLANSLQVSGRFTIELANSKNESLKYKNNNQLLNVTDIVPVLKSAFFNTFTNATNSKKAIAEQEWSPALNYQLLLDESLSLQPKAAPSSNAIVTKENIIINNNNTKRSTIKMQVSSSKLWMHY
jgi:hypothetical protein